MTDLILAETVGFVRHFFRPDEAERWLRILRKPARLTEVQGELCHLLGRLDSRCLEEVSSRGLSASVIEARLRALGAGDECLVLAPRLEESGPRPLAEALEEVVGWSSGSLVLSLGVPLA